MLCRFTELTTARGSAADAEAMAAVLRQASPGVARPMWDILSALPIPVQFVAGELDAKFAALAAKMASARNSGLNTLEGTGKLHRANGNWSMLAATSEAVKLEIPGTGAFIIEGCGHAIHAEQPQALVPVIRRLVQAVDKADHIVVTTCA